MEWRDLGASALLTFRERGHLTRIKAGRELAAEPQPGVRRAACFRSR
jgi:hypothetical protein